MMTLCYRASPCRLCLGGIPCRVEENKASLKREAQGATSPNIPPTNEHAS